MLRLGQRWLGIGVHRPAAWQRADLKLLAGEHRQHAGGGGCRRVDAVDPGVRMAAAQNVGVGLPRTVDVVGVIAATGQEPLVLDALHGRADRSEEHTSELQSLMRISYAVFCLKKKINKQQTKI